MASNTPNINLYKKDPVADGNDTFNIKTMLNDNWDKIDEEVGSIKESLGNLDVPVTSVNEKTGDIILKANDISINDTENNFTSQTIEGALAELFQSATNGKDNLYSALVAKGITPMSREFQDLYNAVMTNDFVRTNDAKAVAANILSGKTAYVNGNLITGTIPSKGAATITPGTTSQTISAGQYLSGVQTIAGDADLISANIKAGASIFGVAGSSNVVDTSSGTATAAQILSGQKAYVKGNLITGSMTNRGAVTNTITTQGGQYTIPAGYHSGAGKVTASFANLTSGNVKKGINIGGVVGTYEQSIDLFKSNHDGTYIFAYPMQEGYNYKSENASAKNYAILRDDSYSSNLSPCIHIWQHLYQSSTDVYSKSVTFVTTNLINLSDVKAIELYFMKGQSDDYHRMAIEISSARDTPMLQSKVAIAKQRKIIDSHVILDTTAYNGSYYIKIGHVANGSGSGQTYLTSYVSRIILVK